MIQAIENRGRNYCIAVKEVENLISNSVIYNAEIVNRFNDEILPSYHSNSIPFINFRNLNKYDIINLIYLIDHQPMFRNGFDLEKQLNLRKVLVGRLNK